MNKITEFQKKHKFTVAQLAKLLDKCERQIYYLKSGKCKITKDLAYRIEIAEGKDLEKELKAKADAAPEDGIVTPSTHGR
jgi:plasmid maintenance system antidote protein VapI